MNYAGLHVHTHYSLFDGIATPQEYVDRAAELGMPAIAITDHGSLSGHREMYRAAKERVSSQSLVLRDTLQETVLTTQIKRKKNDPLDYNYNHLIILAKDANGLETLTS